MLGRVDSTKVCGLMQSIMLLTSGHPPRPSRGRYGLRVVAGLLGENAVVPVEILLGLGSLLCSALGCTVDFCVCSSHGRVKFVCAGGIISFSKVLICFVWHVIYPSTNGCAVFAGSYPLHRRLPRGSAYSISNATYCSTPCRSISRATASPG